MITYEEVISLGWIDKWDKGPQPNNHFYFPQEGGKSMMAFHFKPDEYGGHVTMIVWVDDDVNVNDWENGDHRFYGSLKTLEDLKNIMKYCWVI